MDKKPAEYVEEIVQFIRENQTLLNRDGVVLGLSGGLDSTVAAYLCVQALGVEHCHFLHMPEKDSDPGHTRDARLVAGRLGVRLDVIDISSILRKAGVYRLLPLRFIPTRGLKKKLVLAGKKFVGVGTDGEIPGSRLDADAGSWIAKANAYVSGKHRVRMISLYQYAEVNNLMVVGAANRSELLTGTFVQWGIDHCADIMPLLHLYRSQVLELAVHLGIPEEIIQKPADPDVLPGVSDKEALLGPFKDVDPVLQELERGIHYEILYERFDDDLVDRVNRLFIKSRYMRETPYSMG